MTRHTTYNLPSPWTLLGAVCLIVVSVVGGGAKWVLSDQAQLRNELVAESKERQTGERKTEVLIKGVEGDLKVLQEKVGTLEKTIDRVEESQKHGFQRILEEIQKQDFQRRGRTP